MKPINANETSYEAVELFGKAMLFTCLRIDRSTLPKGLYAYDIRHDDNCQGISSEIAPFILVNHWGTVITRDTIEMGEENYRLMGNEYINYLGGIYSIDELNKMEEEFENEI